MKVLFYQIIPKLFPLFILSDYVFSNIPITRISSLSSLFSRAFHISPAAFLPIVLSLIFGFPIGVAYAISAYRYSALTKEEAERVILMTSSPSFAFTVLFIGGLFSSQSLGVLLFGITVFSSIAVGFFFGSNKRASDTRRTVFFSSFSFVSSVKAAVEKVLVVCGFILFFFGVCGLLLKLPFPFSVLSLSLCEITSCAYFLSSFGLSRFSFSVLSFSLCFSGLSFLFQGYSLYAPCGFSFSRIFFGKTLSGIIGLLLCFFLYPLIA